MIKEYLDMKKAKKIAKDIKKRLGYEYKVIIQNKSDYRDWEININKDSSSEITPEDILILIKKILESCKRYYFSFTISRYGREKVYISIDIRY